MYLLSNYFKVKVKMLLAYRIPTILTLLGQMIQMVLLFFFWKQIYCADLYTMQYAMWSRVVYCFIGENSVWGIAEDIKNGNVSVKLTKPIGYFCHTYIVHLATQFTNFFMACIPLSLVAYIISPIKVSIAQCVLGTVSILLSITICYCFDYIISLFCIFTNNTWGISSLRDGLVQILSGSVVPLYLFPTAISKLIYCFPFAYMVDSPVSILLNNSVQYDMFVRQLCCCGSMLLVIFFIEKIFFRKLQIQGG